MSADTYQFTASDGKMLFVRRFLPEGKPIAVLLVVHGMVEHGGRYSHLALAMCRLGIAVYIPDQRGHGQTEEKSDWGTIADSGGFMRAVGDMRELGLSARKENGDIPLHCMGHSFGSLICVALIGIHGREFEGCILSAVPSRPTAFIRFGGKLIVELGILFKGPRAPGILPRKMTFGEYAKSIPDARTPCDWISRDPAVVSAYMADPACSFTCSYSFYRDAWDGTELVYGPGFLQRIPRGLPVYYFCGSADPVIGGEKGYLEQKTRFETLGLSDFKSRCFPEARHETLNESNRHEVIAELTAWIAARMPGPGRASRGGP